MSEAGKRAAGEAAAELVENGMQLGLGTGSTVRYFLDAIAGKDIAGVPTSEATAARCRSLGIKLLDPADIGELDLCVDGADELDRALNLTKGGGGALLREKVVAAIAARFVVIAADNKLVDRLADSFPLPIEVVPFALGPVRRAVEQLGFDTAVRQTAEAPYRTDNGNAILELRCDGGLEDPAVMDVRLGLLRGVVETGLFIDMASHALLGSADGNVLSIYPSN